ncbi:hypothetical protein B0I35DRAFT_406339 [Stachybotrys elegans]|uniref:Ubiquitin-like domain-containing protein n=1 Tax=Stachybotrys elegans TaxID=80388 RepID=A0A8K0WVK1_9HYPO|nr:hypothetical protein B0I35DRAFT_406339 [Stachybotrys elegans]
MSSDPTQQDSPEVIHLKDAVGRKLVLPFVVARTWTGVSDLISSAFGQIDVLGPKVAQGRYDLIGPDDEIILPSVWEILMINRNRHTPECVLRVLPYLLQDLAGSQKILPTPEPLLRFLLRLLQGLLKSLNVLLRGGKT